MVIDAGYTLAGALTGFLVGLTGVGGGSLMTPILLLVLGVAPTTAVATDLWFASITKIVGAAIHQRAGKVDWQVVRRLWTGSLPVALLVVILISMGDHLSKVSWLAKAVGVVVLITALGMFFSPMLFKLAKGQRLEKPEKFKAWQPVLTVLAGAILGLAVALTSVGAGAIGSVMLLFLYPLRMTPHRLVATDLVHAIPLAMVAGIGYLFAGKVNVSMLGNMLLGSIPAIAIGSLLAGKIPARGVQLALATVLVLVGIRTLV